MHWPFKVVLYDEANIEITTLHFAIKKEAFKDHDCETSLRTDYGFS